jgi:chemotaxis protein MotB
MRIPQKEYARMKKYSIYLVLFAVGLIISGCASHAKDEQIADLKDQLMKTQTRLNELEGQNAEMVAMNDSLRSELGTLVKREDVEMEIKDKYTVLRVPDELFFSSGSATVRQKGQEVIGKLAQIFQKYPEYNIRVEGHTDNKQIKLDFLDSFKSNWELSSARAINVVKRLTSQGHLDPKRLAAVGYGDNHPIASNDTPEGRAKNRRVEFYIVPQLPVKAIKD